MLNPILKLNILYLCWLYSRCTCITSYLSSCIYSVALATKENLREQRNTMKKISTGMNNLASILLQMKAYCQNFHSFLQKFWFWDDKISFITNLTCPCGGVDDQIPYNFKRMFGSAYCQVLCNVSLTFSIFSRLNNSLRLHIESSVCLRCLLSH